MQMVYLKKEKIPISVSSVVLMIVTITYKLVLVMLGLFVLFFQPRITDTYMQNVMPVMWLGCKPQCAWYSGYSGLARAVPMTPTHMAKHTQANGGQ